MGLASLRDVFLVSVRHAAVLYIPPATQFWNASMSVTVLTHAIPLLALVLASAAPAPVGAAAAAPAPLVNVTLYAEALCPYW